MGEYDDTLGPLVLSAFGVNTYFWGIIGFQIVAYKTTNFNDNRIIKALVLILFLVDAFQGIVAIYMIWVFCVSNYLNPPALDTVQMWTYTVIPVCNAVSGVIVHLFLSYRIIRLAKRRNFYGILVGSISIVSAVFALSSGIYSRFHMAKIRPHTTSRALVIVWISAQALADFMISASLSAHLFSKKPEPTEKPDSQSRLSRTTANIVQTGTLSTLFSACTFLLFLASPKTRIYIAFLLPLGRLYTNCLLGILLGRDNGRLKSGQNSPYVTTDIWGVHSRVPEQSQSFNLVRVTTERQVVLDDDIGGYQSKSDKRRFSSRSDVQHSMSDDLQSMRVSPLAHIKGTQTM